MPTTTINLQALGQHARRTIRIKPQEITIEETENASSILVPPLVPRPCYAEQCAWPMIVKATIGEVNKGFSFGDEAMVFPAYRDEKDHLGRRYFCFLLIKLDDETPGDWLVDTLALWVEGGSDGDCHHFPTYAEAVAWVQKQINEGAYTIVPTFNPSPLPRP